MLTPDSELDASETVFRFYPANDAFIPNGQNRQNGGIFIPSSQDKIEAERRGINVRLSVWDIALTTCEQAKRIWGKRDVVVAYGMAVVDVLTIRDLCSRERLRVVHDPLPEHQGLGHDGHCGFEGLDRLPGEEKKALKTLRDVLAQHCFVLAQL